MNDLLAGIALLTSLPIRRPLEYSARALGWFPVVGAATGALLVAVQVVLRLVFPPLVTAAVLVGLWALLTGGLHLDGVSDASDALFAATTRERRLEILRDVHLGSFGAVGIVIVLLLKFSGLYEARLEVVFLAPLLARWAMVYAMTFPLARSEGMAAMFTKGLSRREILLATLLTMLCALPFGWTAVITWIASVAVATLLAQFAITRLGGLTGDIYGLICEGVEVTVLLSGAVLLH